MISDRDLIIGLYEAIGRLSNRLTGERIRIRIPLPSHVHATLELSNLDPLFVSRQLGHSTPETTFRRYARFMKRVARTGHVADRLATAKPGQKRVAQATSTAIRDNEKNSDFAAISV